MRDRVWAEKKPARKTRTRTYHLGRTRRSHAHPSTQVQESVKRRPLKAAAHTSISSHKKISSGPGECGWHGAPLPHRRSQGGQSNASSSSSARVLELPGTSRSDNASSGHSSSSRGQQKGTGQRQVGHSLLPLLLPAGVPLELDVHVQIQKSQEEQVSMTLKLNRTASMKGVTRAVYNFKGGEFYSVFKLSVVAPQEEQAQDGLQAHEAELDLAHVFPEMVPTEANVFAIQLRVASAVNPLDFPKSPTPSEVSSWRGDSGPPKYLLYQQAYGIMVEKVQPLDNLPAHLRPSMDECYLLILLVLKSALLGYYVRDCGWGNLGRRIWPESSTDLPFFLALDTSAWHKRTPPIPHQATTSSSDHVRGLFSALEYLAEDKQAIKAAKQAFTYHHRQVPPLVQHFFSLLRNPAGKEKAERIFRDTSLALSADVWDAFT